MSTVEDEVEYLSYYFILLGCSGVSDVDKLRIHGLIKSNNSWHPSIAEIVTVFNNLGFNTKLFEDNKLDDCKSEEITEVDNFHVTSVKYVIMCLKEIFMQGRGYTPNEITYLVKLLAYICLDVNLKLVCEVQVCVQDCLAYLLDMYSEEEWNNLGEFHELCESLCSSRLHHRNQLELCYILPPTPRGIQLSKSLAHLCLQCYLGIEDSNLCCIDIIKPSDILKLMQLIDPGENCYALITRFKLLDLAVSHNTFRREIDKKILRKIARTFDEIVNQIPVNYDDSNFLFAKYGLSSSLKFKFSEIC